MEATSGTSSDVVVKKSPISTAICGAEGVQDASVESRKGTFLDIERPVRSYQRHVLRLVGTGRMAARHWGTPARGTPSGGQTIIPAVTTF